jgi:valyl-tRNA synthetase
LSDAPSRFEPAEAEPRWRERWLSSGALRGDPTSPGDPYVIAVPPPNVTGALHMGHALNGTVQDTLVRRHRMAGRVTEWVCGTDHAGIATQAVVEKELAKDGVARRDLGREEFLRRVWEWREQSGGQIVEQFKALGLTLDYTRERFTMDDAYAKAVLHVFVTLYEKGLIYRDRYMVNWDPGLQSAVSDLEVEDREVTDSLVSIAYPLVGVEGEVVVATVRPETMLGDTAVAVNPDDERYKHLIGSRCRLPLTDREIPIVGDRHVDPAFGTGCLKVTPAHDPNDFEIARRHNLPEVSVIGEDGLMTALAGERYAGLRPSDCAARVKQDLADQGLLRGEEPYTHNVPFSHRSGERIEPLLSLQWFCDMKDLAAPAIAVVKDGRVRFHPEAPHAKVYLEWMENIRPWCVSRQLWWGHQLPVWYRGDEVYVGHDVPEGDDWVRDPDVLDTWFSSALWPFATLGWPEATAEVQRFYPGHVLSTARDIIFLWVARMVMMGIEYLGQPPFQDVYIHSVIQAADGRRMSKSLGTGIDPLELIEAHGADAVRFGLLLMASQQDVRFSEERVRQGRQLVTKLWNATRLVTERGGVVADAPPTPETAADRWIASRVSATVQEADSLVAAYDFSGFADLLYHTIFDDFCDWYLEFLKAGEATPEVAAHVLEQILALAHPVMPFVTEECWARLAGGDSLMLTHAPPVAPGPRDEAVEAQVEKVQAEVVALRQYRADNGLRPREELTISPMPDALTAALAAPLKAAEPDAALSPITVPGGGIFQVAAAGKEVDVEAERTRMAEEVARLEKEIARCEKQLGNEKFTSRAPAHLVDAEREKLARYEAERAALTAQLTALP